MELSTPSKTKANVAHAGLSHQRGHLKEHMRSRQATLNPCPSSSWSTAISVATDVMAAPKKVPSTTTLNTMQSQRMSTRTRQLTRIAPMTPPRSPKSQTHLTLRSGRRVLLR